MIKELHMSERTPEPPDENPPPRREVPGHEEPTPRNGPPPREPTQHQYGQRPPTDGYGQQPPGHEQQPPNYGYGQQPPAYGAPGQAYGQPNQPSQYWGPGQPYVEQKSRLIGGLLGILLGGLGVHRFYLGHVGLGIIQIVVTFITFGFGAIWGFIEGIMILVGAEPFRRDARGIPLKE